MEILNHNQRRSAKWRLFFIGLAILGITATSLAAIKGAYSGGGAHELEECKKKLEEQKQNFLGREQNLEIENNRLKKELKALKKNGNKPNTEIAKLKDLIELKDEQIKTLKTDLTSCQTNLNQF